MPLDYVPNAQVLMPGSDSTQVSVTGAGNYGTARAPTATPDGTSERVRSTNPAPNIGHDATDAPALAAVLQKKGVLP